MHARQPYSTTYCPTLYPQPSWSQIPTGIPSHAPCRHPCSHNSGSLHSKLHCPVLPSRTLTQPASCIAGAPTTHDNAATSHITLSCRISTGPGQAAQGGAKRHSPDAGTQLPLQAFDLAISAS
mmetsp:Transcript_13029/g.31886  ORF Transcript_13029/g.31886 Transcript_13029/m.31886 type:complete len:123 (-) Transcript_13029:151-519(-)